MRWRRIFTASCRWTRSHAIRKGISLCGRWIDADVWTDDKAPPKGWPRCRTCEKAVGR